ncbi:alpha/beta fold hydrolase [Symbioplanes lichenis]|uniref:alpha/beta fold hydrolase n=1 Tax=Symbioplanes lichenis TaxID=1629072 RepID=UPI0027383358|nr:alpha/beta hydrolase [Actinoplanes lichenis]
MTDMDPAGPGLPGTFARTFRSRLIPAGDVTLHAVTGGAGPALLLLPGWPQTWYAWREVMPALARDFSVVAADPRGTGLSDKPGSGYDTGTMAEDLVRMMAALGHERFAVIGQDVGAWTAYALAADHPAHVTRLALVEATIPALGEDGQQWHVAFNRLDGLNEELVRGREHLYFGHQFATKAYQALPSYAVEHYIDILRDPDALRASFEPYRALEVTYAQNERRAAKRLGLPVLVIGGAQSVAGRPGVMLAPVAGDLTGVVLDNCGHYPAEEVPAEFLEEIGDFF